MKKFIFSPFVLVIIVSLLIGNLYVFVSNMKLSEEIAYFNDQIHTLKIENSLLDNKLTMQNSLSEAASVAAQLNFTKKATLYHLSDLGMAKK